MTALETRVVAALRDGVPDMKALRLKLGCTMAELRAALQRLRWTGQVEMGALRLSPSMITESADKDCEAPPPQVPAEAARVATRVQQGAGAATPDAPAPIPRHNAQGAAGLERTRLAAAERSRVVDAVREEAEVTAARRRAARATGGGQKPLTLSAAEQLTTMLVEEPEDAIRAVRRKWPDLWGRVVLRAREEGTRPGPMMFALIERGLGAANG